LECTTYAQHDGGDHTIVVGQVVRASGWAAHDEENSPTPLTYYRGTYLPSV
jgi:flavin reductase (DIM6/NTAB) family NADH-FMN oxidoreductase RutF